MSVSITWDELVQYSVDAYNLIEPYSENYNSPIYDYKTNSEKWCQPEYITLVFLYLVSGDPTYLDLAKSALEYACNNLVNANNVMLTYDKSSHSPSTDMTVRVYALALYLQASVYIAKLDSAYVSYAKKIGDVILEHQQGTGLFAHRLNPDGTVAISDEGDGTAQNSRYVIPPLIWLYELTNDTTYLNAVKDCLDALYGYEDSNHLVPNRIDSVSGSINDSTTRCSQQQMYVYHNLLYYLASGNETYNTRYQNALQGLYDVFWKGSYWMYRSNNNIIEHSGAWLDNNFYANDDYVSETDIDFDKRYIQLCPLTDEYIQLHAVYPDCTLYSKPPIHFKQLYISTCCHEHYRRHQNETAWETGVQTFKALQYMKKSYGYVYGIDPYTHEPWTEWNPWFWSCVEPRWGFMLAFCAMPLLIKLNGVKIDWGIPFNCPVIMGHGLAIHYDIMKNQFSLKDKYIKLSLTGTGSVTFETGYDIDHVYKNGSEYTNFSGKTLTVDGDGVYEVYFGAEVTPPPVEGYVGTFGKCWGFRRYSLSKGVWE